MKITAISLTPIWSIIGTLLLTLQRLQLPIALLTKLLGVFSIKRSEVG